VPRFAGQLPTSDVLPPPSTPFPVTGGAFQTSPLCSAINTVCSNAVVFKVNAAGTALVYSPFIGSGGPSAGAVDPADGVAVVGALGPPFVNPVTPPQNGSDVPVVEVLNPSGSALLFSTSLESNVTAVAIDSPGNI
jgi:hypothetical protein